MKQLTIAEICIILAQARVRYGYHPLAGVVIDFIVSEIEKKTGRADA